jgi:DNA-binding PadR family transcriptional regulator
MEAVDLIPLNPRDYLILFALVDRERHGYGIVKEVERGSHGQVRIDPANLYRAIKRMISTGLVEEGDRRTSADAADERRRYYRITPLGRETVKLEAARLAELTAAARARDLLPGAEATS